ncbi:MAG: stage II sporulation protein R [Clostridia bacterium]
MIPSLFRRKHMLATAVLIVLTAALFCLPAGKTPSARAEDILRLHVIANSDSAEDQRVKLLVRDKLLQVLPAMNSAAETEAYLLSHGRDILMLVENTLRENGKNYRAQLMLGRYPFPDRTYGNKSYPAGDYNALRIVLGNGLGQNWWCVLFPPLCIVTADQQPLPEADEITFESSIMKWFHSWEVAK